MKLFSTIIEWLKKHNILKVGLKTRTYTGTGKGYEPPDPLEE